MPDRQEVWGVKITLRRPPLAGHRPLPVSRYMMPSMQLYENTRSGSLGLLRGTVLINNHELRVLGPVFGDTTSVRCNHDWSEVCRANFFWKGP